MQVIEDQGVEDILQSGSEDRFPFPFLSSYRKYLSGVERGEIIWGLDEDVLMPILKKSKGGFTIWQCLFPPVRQGQRLSKEEETRFLDELVSTGTEKHLVHRIIQPPTFALFQSAPSKSTSAPFGSYVIDLTSVDLDDIWMGMKSNYRQVIRKAEREGVAVKTGVDQLGVFYSLYETTTQKAHIYQEPFSDFEQVTRMLGPDNAYCSVAWVDGEPDGGIFALYSKFGAYVLHAGLAEHVRHHGSMKLLHWTAMQFLKDKGVGFYDFVGARLSDVSGTPLEGIQRFKSGFGSELKEGVLWKCDIDPVRCKLADTVQYIRHGGNTNHEDIIDQERKKIGV